MTRAEAMTTTLQQELLAQSDAGSVGGPEDALPAAGAALQNQGSTNDPRGMFANLSAAALDSEGDSGLATGDEGDGESMLEMGEEEEVDEGQEVEQGVAGGSAVRPAGSSQESGSTVPPKPPAQTQSGRVAAIPQQAFGAALGCAPGRTACTNLIDAPPTLPAPAASQAEDKAGAEAGLAQAPRATTPSAPTHLLQPWLLQPAEVTGAWWRGARPPGSTVAGAPAAVVRAIGDVRHTLQQPPGGFESVGVSGRPSPRLGGHGAAASGPSTPPTEQAKSRMIQFLQSGGGSRRQGVKRGSWSQDLDAAGNVACAAVAAPPSPTTRLGGVESEPPTLAHEQQPVIRGSGSGHALQSVHVVGHLPTSSHSAAGLARGGHPAGILFGESPATAAARCIPPSPFAASTSQPHPPHHQGPAQQQQTQQQLQHLQQQQVQQQQQQQQVQPGWGESSWGCYSRPGSLPGMALPPPTAATQPALVACPSHPLPQPGAPPTAPTATDAADLDLDHQPQPQLSQVPSLDRSSVVMSEAEACLATSEQGQDSGRAAAPPLHLLPAPAPRPAAPQLLPPGAVFERLSVNMFEAASQGGGDGGEEEGGSWQQIGGAAPQAAAGEPGLGAAAGQQWAQGAVGGEGGGARGGHRAAVGQPGQAACHHSLAATTGVPPAAQPAASVTSGLRGSSLVAGSWSGAASRVHGPPAASQSQAALIQQMHAALHAWQYMAHNASTPSTVLTAPAIPAAAAPPSQPPIRAACSSRGRGSVGLRPGDRNDE